MTLAQLNLYSNQRHRNAKAKRGTVTNAPNVRAAKIQNQHQKAELTFGDVCNWHETTR